MLIIRLEDVDIKNSQDAVKVLQAKIKDKAKEHFKLILLRGSSC